MATPSSQLLKLKMLRVFLDSCGFSVHILYPSPLGSLICSTFKMYPESSHFVLLHFQHSDLSNCLYCLDCCHNLLMDFLLSPLAFPTVCSQQRQQTHIVRHELDHINPLLNVLPWHCLSQINLNHHSIPVWIPTPTSLTMSHCPFSTTATQPYCPLYCSLEMPGTFPSQDPSTDWCLSLECVFPVYLHGSLLHFQVSALVLHSQVRPLRITLCKIASSPFPPPTKLLLSFPALFFSIALTTV